MTKNLGDNKYFILIKKKKILFQALNMSKEQILKKETYINNYQIDSIYSLLENFLDKNIIEIEKTLKNFVKEIYIIFDSDLFFSVPLSIKCNYQKKNFKLEKINDIFLGVKNQYNKYSPKDQIIHMVIDNHSLKEIDRNLLKKEINNQELVIQVNFICLKDQIVMNLKKIFSDYEITVKKILCFSYLKNFNDFNENDIFQLANNNLNGLYKNEVHITSKNSEKLGIFEKFFNFFR